MGSQPSTRGRDSARISPTIPAGGEIGEEVHSDTDQALVFVDVQGEARLDGKTSPVVANDLVLVRAGTRHNFVNTGPEPLRLITVYAPPHHRPGTVHRTREEAEAAERGAQRGGRSKTGRSARSDASIRRFHPTGPVATMPPEKRIVEA